MLKHIRLFLAAACAGVALQGSGLAADLPSRTAAPAAPAPAVDSGWSGSITLYGWAMGMDGTVQTFSRVPPAHVNVGFDQLLKNLDGGLMVAGSLMKDRYVLFGDVIFAKLSPKKNFAVDGFNGTVTLDATNFIGLAAGGYRVYTDPTFSLDLMVGARVFSVGSGLTVSVPGVAVEVADRTKTWVDGVVGLRAIYNITDRWHLVGIAFAGGLSSQYEWDVFASIGYDFDKTWSGFVGYRALGVNYRSDGFIYDVVQHGPVIGISARF